MGAITAAAGAYTLRFELTEPLSLKIQTLNNPVLGPGSYVYVGSAYGPGGIAARVGRHLRTSKKPHWHIDHLSTNASCVEVGIYPGGNECDLVADLLEAGGTIAVPGFGSSDCRRCAAHLVRLAAP